MRLLKHREFKYCPVCENPKTKSWDFLTSKEFAQERTRSLASGGDSEILGNKQKAGKILNPTPSIGHNSGTKQIVFVCRLGLIVFNLQKEGLNSLQIKVPNSSAYRDTSQIKCCWLGRGFDKQISSFPVVRGSFRQWWPHGMCAYRIYPC
jgi:hypothetical protein